LKLCSTDAVDGTANRGAKPPSMVITIYPACRAQGNQASIGQTLMGNNYSVLLLMALAIGIFQSDILASRLDEFSIKIFGYKYRHDIADFHKSHSD
jgi:hypothetical protein